MAFPVIKKKNQGKFTSWVKKNMPGSSTCAAASKIMAAKKGKYSSEVRDNDRLESNKNKGQHQNGIKKR